MVLAVALFTGSIDDPAGRDMHAIAQAANEA